MSKIAYVAVVVISFYVGKIGILDTTINNAIEIEPDLSTKQSFIDTGAQTIKNIKEREKKLLQNLRKLKKFILIIVNLKLSTNF